MSGVIINTGGWVRGQGYDAIKHAAGAFEGQGLVTYLILIVFLFLFI